jgi:hypothetical protein
MTTNSLQKPLKKALGLTVARVTGETHNWETGVTPNSGTNVTPKRVTHRSYKLRARHCKNCGEVFTPKSKHGRFCSDTCRKAAWKKERRKHPKPPKEKPLELQTCAGCRQGFFGVRGQKHCTPSCKTAAWRHRRQAAIAILAFDMQISETKAADVVEVSGMKKITAYLTTRGYVYNDVEQEWMFCFTVTDC